MTQNYFHANSFQTFCNLSRKKDPEKLRHVQIFFSLPHSTSIIFLSWCCCCWCWRQREGKRNLQDDSSNSSTLHTILIFILRAATSTADFLQPNPLEVSHRKARQQNTEQRPSHVFVSQWNCFMCVHSKGIFYSIATEDCAFASRLHVSFKQAVISVSQYFYVDYYW